MVTAQVMDALIVFVCGKSFAIEIVPSPGFLSWNSTDETPFFGEGYFIFTLGYVVTTVCFMPMGFMNLDDVSCNKFTIFYFFFHLLTNY